MVTQSGAEVVEEKPTARPVTGRPSGDVNQLLARLRTGRDVARRAAVQAESVGVTFGDVDPTAANGCLLTTAQVARMFQITTMTIHNWRRKRGMPYQYLQGGRKPPVRYDEGLLLAWAKMHGAPIINEDYKYY